MRRESMRPARTRAGMWNRPGEPSGVSGAEPLTETHMAWTYSGYESETGATAQRAMLIQHIKEVRDSISANLSADGRSRDVSPLTEYLQSLMDEKARYDKQLGLGAHQRTNPLGLADFR